jgi:PAS domain-containing protein
VIARPELPENAETLFRAVAAVADALYVVDAAGRITFLNPAALKILGYADEDELLGCPSHETRLRPLPRLALAIPDPDHLAYRHYPPRCSLRRRSCRGVLPCGPARPRLARWGLRGGDR